MTRQCCAVCLCDLDVLKEQTIDHKAALLFFLIGAAQAGQMFNGRSAKSALEGARIALGMTPAHLAQVIDIHRRRQGGDDIQ